MEPSVQAVIEHVEESVPGFHAPDPGLEPRASLAGTSGAEDGGH
jgi:hypothetical protein